jgi:hypothetical protein
MLSNIVGTSDIGFRLPIASSRNRSQPVADRWGGHGFIPTGTISNKVWSTWQ